MDAKLTLKLNKDTILRAKKYAKAHNISLSRLIEGQLDAITSEIQEDKYKPAVQRLAGITKE
jgi:hypothetical protein